MGTDEPLRRPDGSLELVEPTARLREAVLQARADWGPGAHEDGGLSSPGDSDSPTAFAAWVASLREAADDSARLAAGAVHASCWWVVEDGRVLGAIALRHRLAPETAHLGHIGYGVRPTARGRGVATWALGQVVQRAADRGMDRVLLSCLADNTASRRTIEHQGGVLDEVRQTPSGPVCSYSIATGRSGA